MSLEAYAFDDLLVLYWQRQEKITPGISLQIDQIELPKPVLGAEFVEATSYILASYCKGIARRKDPNIRIVDSSGQILAETTAPKLTKLPASLVAEWSLLTRIRIEKILLIRTPASFPALTPATLGRIAESLIETRVFTCRSPDGKLYVRIPWMPQEEPALLPITLRLAGTSSADSSIACSKALAEGGYLHFFLISPEDHWSKKATYRVELDNVRCAVFKISCLKSPVKAESLQQWMDTLLTDYTGNFAALKAFCLLQLTPPPKPRQRLSGRVTGIRAGSLIGTAWDRERPDQVIPLEISVDDVQIGTVEAHLPNAAQQDGMPINCSFNWPLDSATLGDQPHEIHVRNLATGESLAGSPLYWGPGHYDGEFAINDEGFVTGWVAARSHSVHPLNIRLSIDGEAQAEFCARPLQSSLRHGFSLPVPDVVFDTHLHRLVVEVRREDSTDWVTLAQGMGVKTTYQGHIDFLNTTRLAGWIINRTAPKRPVPLDLRINGNRVAHQRADSQRSDIKQGELSRCGFDFELSGGDWQVNTQVVSLHLAGTPVEVLGPAILATPWDVAIRALTTAAEVLNQADSDGAPYGLETTLWVRTQVITKVLNELKRAKTLPAKLTLDLSSLVRIPEHAEIDPVVDVIVPVYGGKTSTLRCLNSVLNARTDVKYELIVIDDASIEAELVSELRAWATAGRFTLLENSSNIGFVGTVNRGMRLHTGRDVVLLNSDTEVADGWLDRIRAAAHRESNIGTVTPLSNNATICSVPIPDQDNLLPETFDVAKMNALCARLNAGVAVDIPTAVGFCMFIKRKVLDEVGYFNEALWGKGYAEENDFCLKSSSLGWRHLAATDVFVWHEGGTSFGDSKESRVLANLDKLSRIYPDYGHRIQRFQAQDPLAVARNRIIIELLRQKADRYVLFVIHGLGGGTQVAADTLAQRLHAEGYGVLELMSLASGQWQVTAEGLPYTLKYHSADRFDRLVEDLKSLEVWHIHYHQTMQFPQAIWTLPENLGIPYDVSLHDYLPICPRITMMDESGYYCEESQYSVENCTRCLRINGFDTDERNQIMLLNKFDEFGGDIRSWREYYAAKLARARRVIAPSQTVADIFQSHFDLHNIQVIPHPENTLPGVSTARVLRPNQVVIMGAIGVHKGYDILLQCVRNACKQGLPLHYTVIGYTCDDATLLQYPNVTITGAYQPENLPERIAETQAGVALFLSPWPETYCFALSEAWSQGLYPVALDIGAVGARIRATGQGHLLALHSSAKVINQTLLQLFQSPLPPLDWPAPVDQSSVAETYYGWNSVASIQD